MPSGTGMDMFGKKFPGRMFDVGIAEQHAITFAAGLATEGYKPYAAIYSTFLQRAYDQVIHDVCIQSLPVIFCLDRAGIAGSDGPTNHGAYDLAYMRCLHNMIVSAPMNESELRNLMYTAQLQKDKPFTIRYPRGQGVLVNWKTPFKKIKIGKGRKVSSGKDLAILTIGHIGNYASKAIIELNKIGINPSHYDMRFVKPLDENLVWQLATDHEAIITIEEGSIGGFGAHVAKFLSEKNLLDKGLKFRSMILPDKFIEQDKPESMYKFAGLDSQSIEEKIIDLLNSNIILQKQKQ